MNSFVKKIVTVAATAALTLSSAAALAAAPLQLGVPDDGTNLSRGIKLLEAAGFIKVDPAAGYTPEIKDITDYLYNVEVTPGCGQHAALHAGRFRRFHHQRHLARALRPDSFPRCAAHREAG